jgi:hypothetical protein
MKRPARGGPFCNVLLVNAHHAALSHIAVSKALHIIGMFIPKLGLMPFLLAALAAGLTSGAVSTARSHDPFSWERATEKNKNT